MLSLFLLFGSASAAFSATGPAYAIEKVSYTFAASQPKGGKVQDHVWVTNTKLNLPFIAIGEEVTMSFSDDAANRQLAAGSQVVLGVFSSDADCGVSTKQRCNGPYTLTADSGTNTFQAKVTCMELQAKSAWTAGSTTDYADSNARFCFRKTATSAWSLQKHVQVSQCTTTDAGACASTKPPGMTSAATCTASECPVNVEAKSECNGDSTAPLCLGSGALTGNNLDASKASNLRWQTECIADPASQNYVYPGKQGGWYLEKGKAVETELSVCGTAPAWFVNGGKLFFAKDKDADGPTDVDCTTADMKVTDTAAMTCTGSGADMKCTVKLTMTVDPVATQNYVMCRMADATIADPTKADTMKRSAKISLNTIQIDGKKSVSASPSPSPNAVTTSLMSPMKAGDKLASVDSTTGASFSAGNGVCFGQSTTASDYECNSIATIGTGSAYLNSFLMAANSITWNLSSGVKYDHGSGTVITKSSSSSSSSNNWWDQWWTYWSKFGFNPFFFPWWGMWPFFWW